MKIARRTFLIGGGVFAASPAFANLLASASGDGAHAQPSSAPRPPVAGAAGQADLVFRIDGWDMRDPVAPDHAPTAGSDAWIRVDQSWRTAWR